MDLMELQRHWDAFGRKDPLWAILAHPGKEGGKWDVSEFFKTGEDDIDPIIKTANLKTKDIALDFGCGVGRLTQAMAKHFEKVIGVDISPSMVKLAKKYNKYGNRCQYHMCNSLSQFHDYMFDFIFTILVLQHMDPIYSRNYIREFIRILKPGGLLIFQIPSEPIERPIPGANRGFPRMEMHGIPMKDVLQLINDLGGKSIATYDGRFLTPGWNGYIYWVGK